MDVMGLIGLSAIRAMVQRVRAIRRVLKAEAWDLVVLIDNPGLNFHFARVAKAAGRRVLYYIAPQVWAWRPGRMKWIQRRVDHVVVRGRRPRPRRATTRSRRPRIRSWCAGNAHVPAAPRPGRSEVRGPRRGGPASVWRRLSCGASERSYLKTLRVPSQRKSESEEYRRTACVMWASNVRRRVRR